MAEKTNCPKCGADLPANAPKGLCPRCLMKAGMQTDSEGNQAGPADLGGAGPTSDTPPRGFVPPEPAELAKQFAQLEIIELLGQGGMGAVYKARQRELDRLVALKILPPQVGMTEAFADADIVYPKSWAPYEVMQRRTELLNAGDSQGLEALEAECLEMNRGYLDWECNEELMKKTNNGLYLHCLPADISGVSCEHGEVAASVFERFRLTTYGQAGYKPYIIAAMMFLSKIGKPAEVLSRLLQNSAARSMI